MKGEQLTVSPLSSFFDDVIGEELEERWRWGESLHCRGNATAFLCAKLRLRPLIQLKPSRKAQLGDNQVDLGQWFLIA